MQTQAEVDAEVAKQARESERAATWPLLMESSRRASLPRRAPRYRDRGRGREHAPGRRRRYLEKYTRVLSDSTSPDYNTLMTNGVVMSFTVPEFIPADTTAIELRVWITPESAMSFNYIELDSDDGFANGNGKSPAFGQSNSGNSHTHFTTKVPISNRKFKVYAGGTPSVNINFSAKIQGYYIS